MRRLLRTEWDGARGSGAAGNRDATLAERRAEFEEQGYVVVEDALDASTVARLLAAVDRVWDRHLRLGATHRDDLHQFGFVGLDESFLDLLDHPATFPLVCRLLGWNIYLYHCHLDVHPPAPDPGPKWRWHQDGGRQNVELETPRPRLSVKVGYFLTDVTTRDHGPLWVIPGSHTSDVLERPEDGRTRPDGAVPLLVGSGSAVVFDRRLWHARGDNRSSASRKALFYAYTYRWIRARDELELDDEVLARLDHLDPVRKQLLGDGTSAIGYWIPTDGDVPLRRLLVS